MEERLIEEMWQRVKASKSPGFKAPGTERVFKAGIRWGAAMERDEAATMRRFGDAFRGE